MIDREVKILFGKEIRQLIANKSALVTSAILPIITLGVVPALFTFVTQVDPEGDQDEIPEALRVGILGELVDDPQRLPVAMLPLFIALVGLIVPTIMASQLLITERERRTLELLVALPVRVEQILVAKFGAVIVTTCAITLPLLAVHLCVFPALGIASLGDLLALPLLLLCGLALGTSASLLTALLSRDVRTASNVTGALLTPCLLFTFFGGFLLPGGPVRPLVIALVYLALALIALRVAIKKVTFERLLA